MTTPWDLFLDDERDPSYVSDQPDYAPDATHVARTVAEAQRLILHHGLPRRIWFDHDLGLVRGEPSDSAQLLRWLLEVDELASTVPPPAYTVHSANPSGAATLHSLMRSWRKLYEMNQPSRNP